MEISACVEGFPGSKRLFSTDAAFNNDQSNSLWYQVFFSAEFTNRVCFQKHKLNNDFTWIIK